MNEAIPPPASVDSADWQPLPQRARLLCVLGPLPIAVPTAAGCVIVSQAFDSPWPWSVACGAIGLLAGTALAIRIGLKHYRHTFWRLDEDGLAIRRGRMWQRETRVPANRVQHLDIKRGPLQRRRDLATLVVYTAGTRHSAVMLPHLAAEDAQRLRDRLGRQLDLDDDA
jgi:membrane protein YdbS with pleckstrin-like domain